MSVDDSTGLSRSRRAAWLGHLLGVAALGVVASPALAVLFSLARHAALGSDVAFALARGLLGSLEIVGLAAVVAVPLGLATGTCLAKNPGGKLERVASGALDALLGVPTIVIGVVVYAVVTLPLGRLSVLAGGLALASVVYPRVARETADLFAELPASVHQATTGLGARSWHVTWFLLSRTLRRGLVGSSSAALVAAFGEVAAVLFTTVPGREGSWSGPFPSLAVEAFQAVHAADASAVGRAATLCLALSLVTIALGAASRQIARRAE